MLNTARPAAGWKATPPPGRAGTLGTAQPEMAAATRMLVAGFGAPHFRICRSTVMGPCQASTSVALCCIGGG